MLSVVHSAAKHTHGMMLPILWCTVGMVSFSFHRTWQFSFVSPDLRTFPPKWGHCHRLQLQTVVCLCLEWFWSSGSRSYRCRTCFTVFLLLFDWFAFFVRPSVEDRNVSPSWTWGGLIFFGRDLGWFLFIFPSCQKRGTEFKDWPLKINRHRYNSSRHRWCHLTNQKLEAVTSSYLKAQSSECVKMSGQVSDWMS